MIKKQGALLTETHLHTTIGSSCGIVDPVETIRLYRDAGYNAIIVTDHYYGKTWDKYHKTADDWLDGYRTVRDLGKDAGIRVFLGMELRLKGAIDDFLVYGFDEKFLIKNNLIYELSLPEIFQLAEAYGFLVYQAHPFREGHVVRDPKFMHGVEVFNSRPRFASDNEKALAFAEENSLLMIAGGDFHSYEDAGRSGVWLDEAIETEKELVEYLRTNELSRYMGLL